MTSSNTLFKFLAKNKSDNEETPLKQPRQDAFTLKQEHLERINLLHIKCGFLDNKNLFMLNINGLKYHEVLDVNVDITQNLYNVNCTPISFLC